MKTKVIIIIVGLLISIQVVNAQQMPQYTQYIFNDYIINPAIAGTSNSLQIRGFSRQQWLGIEGSPQTYSISVYGPTKEEPMGYGGYIYNDYTGPTSRLVFKGSYAYNIFVNETMRLSGGLSLGGMQYKFDGTAINMTPELEDDPAIDGTVRSMFIPDASAGLYLYSTRFFVSLSAHQLIGNKLNKLAAEQIGINRLKQHYYLAGGYNLMLDKDFLLQPTVLIRQMFPSTPQAEITAKVVYQRMVWGGLSFRTSDAVSIMAGYKHENRWYFGAAYDITYSELRQYSRGTVEVLFGFKFNDIK